MCMGRTTTEVFAAKSSGSRIDLSASKYGQCLVCKVLPHWTVVKLRIDLSNLPSFIAIRRKFSLVIVVFISYVQKVHIFSPQLEVQVSPVT